MYLSHPETILHPWSMEKLSLMPKRFGTAVLEDFSHISLFSKPFHVNWLCDPGGGVGGGLRVGQVYLLTF